MTTKVIVCDYNPVWAEHFWMLKEILAAALNGLDFDIQHVGSTSIPGLAAKPIIDIDIIVESGIMLPVIITRLEKIGYTHLGDLGIPQRDSFKHLTGRLNGMTLPEHNLYVCIKGSDSVKNHLALRDYLRAHPEKASEYSALKRHLMIKYPENIDKYVEGKTPFIITILQECGFSIEALEAIIAANKEK